MKTPLLLVVLFCFVFSKAQTIGLQSFASGFTRPLEIVNSGDDRLFVVEQRGLIKILNPNGATNATPFLDLTGMVATGNEQGLLGLVFHPNYTSNGYFYTNHTNTSGTTVITRYSVDSSNPNIANTSSATVLLTIVQPYTNHNGGTLKFGPDGYLYIGMGDGGSGGDPENRAQNINDLLGKILRIDVNSGSPYSIPSSNPYVGVAGSDEIWAIGLRNPWKFSFDKTTGNLWIADVGQNNVEEINVAPASDSGLNYGWRCYEGDVAYNTTGCPSQTSMKFPLKSINHSTGACSITGGYVYNGTQYPNFKGLYFFTDYCNPQIGMLSSNGNLVMSQAFSNNNFSSFGEDKNGELYIAAINSGTIYKIVDSTLSTAAFDQAQFAIYPNPANSEIIIQNSDKNYPTEVILFDIEGKMLLKQKTENKKVNKIQIEHLSKGFYVVTVKDNNSKLQTYKLIVE